MYYILTLPESYMGRRELFAPVKNYTLVAFLFSSLLWQTIDIPGSSHVFGFTAAMFLATFLAITFLAPSIIATAATTTKDIGNKTFVFPRVYLAHTGYYDDNARPIYGLYAGQFISSG